MSHHVCRWGILGAADIAKKNWKALRNAENCHLVAVASREPKRCREFIARCQAEAPFDPPPRACADYEELLADREIDAVYLPLPTGVRKPWVLRAVQAGKHVLIEKPVGVTTADVTEILDACRAARVQLMDGVMFMHSRRLRSMRQVLDSGQIGSVRRVASEFSFGAPDEFFAANIRTDSRLEPLGCLGDLGWYNLRFTLWALGWQMPSAVSGHVLGQHHRPGSPAPVPTEFSAELYYPDGRSASFYCSFRTEIQQWAALSGTKGSITVPDFVLPYYGSEAVFNVANPVFNVVGCDFNMEPRTRRHAVAEYSNSSSHSQESAMFRTFARLAMSGEPDPFWGEIALKTQQVLDACLQSARSGGQMVTLDSPS
jgi:predicted dehydrogenase